jgi:N-acetylmuramoyl-L-alanine amidase
VFKPAAIIVGAAILLAGCSSTPTAPEETISSSPVMTGENASLNWTNPNATGQFLPPRSSPPAVRPGPGFTTPVTTWTSLNRWAAENKIGEPHLLSHTPVASYAIGTPNGTLVLDIGSREASWNGVEINLGFAPQFIDDQVFVHGLDLQKNLAPLLFGQPLAFGQRVIVIDPGHGGVNVGTHSVVDGRFEKEFTLDWALRLAPLLATNGWQVFLTRTNDVDVALSNRVLFAEAHHADLFISLHFNSTPDRNKETAGLETYCSTPAGMPSSLTRDYADTWSQSFPNNNFDAQNLQLAVHLHTVLLHTMGEEDRGVRRARFIGVLHGQRHPAVLVEGGYLSNPREARLIESPEFRQKLAEAVASALK